jgi:RNA polymerase sigma-70 factor (ECF subfamily)
VHRALGDLTPTARVIVMMFYFDDKSYQQIAQELNIPLGTVMSRLSRSKEVLRDALLKSGCSNQDTSLLISKPN